MRHAFAALFLTLLAVLPANAAGVALVLAVDVSESVSSGRYMLQREGIARAFESPQLVEAIAAVPGGIEALVVEWSDPEKIAITVGWTRIANRGSAAAFAAAVRARQAQFERADRDRAGAAGRRRRLRLHAGGGSHKVIDISGDGMANFGVPPAEVRDRLVARGITINGLAILSEEPWLDEYYRKNVIGGPASFVAVAKDFDSFAEAILRKLVQEVASLPARAS